MSKDVADPAKMRETVGVTFPLYTDPDLAVSDAWGVRDHEYDIALPATFVVDRDGHIVYEYIGEGPPDRPDTDAVLAVLRELQGTEP